MLEVGLVGWFVLVLVLQLNLPNDDPEETLAYGEERLRRLLCWVKVLFAHF